jgi:excisionase family DNA binding protein
VQHSTVAITVEEAVVSARVSNSSLLVSSKEIEQARQIGSVIDLTKAAAAFDIVTEHDHIRVPAELAGVVWAIIDAMTRSETVTVGAVPPEVTTTVAAKELGISRPTLMKMISAGEISAHKVGSHTRLKTVDILALRQQRRDTQRHAFEDLRRFEDSVGLDDH